MKPERLPGSSLPATVLAVNKRDIGKNKCLSKINLPILTCAIGAVGTKSVRRRIREHILGPPVVNHSTVHTG